MRGFLRIAELYKKVRPALGGEPAAASPVWGRGGWGRDRGRKRQWGSKTSRRDVAVAVAVRGSPSETQTLGSDWDCRLTKR
jgi:hypothetical protein